MSQAQDIVSRALPRNVKLFLVFRVFFNARYYYPIFALLFLDLGLSLEQFSALNAVWAATIVLLEVPSGALADVWGRRRLLRIASVLMALEMLCLLVPRWDPTWLWPAMVLNRLCSGAAEAMASGADEALAYDSLPEEQKGRWSHILELSVRYLSIAMMVAMLVGALVYDPRFWQSVGAPEAFLRWVPMLPVFLTLAHSVIVIWAALQMNESDSDVRPAKGWETIRAAFYQAKETVLWLLSRPRLRFVILCAMLFDHLIRQALVVSADVYSALGITQGWLGPLGALAALLGTGFVSLVAWVARRWAPGRMFWVLYLALTVASLTLSWAVSLEGVIPMLAISLLSTAVGYLTSLYLNELVDSRRRATVLSLKGLGLNLAYGWISLAYGGWVAMLQPDGGRPQVLAAFEVYPVYLTGLVIVLLMLAPRTPGAWGEPGGYGQSKARKAESPYGSNQASV